MTLDDPHAGNRCRSVYQYDWRTKWYCLKQEGHKGYHTWNEPRAPRPTTTKDEA